MGVLRAASTNSVTFTPDSALDSLTLSATVAGASVSLGTPTEGSETIPVWTLDIQSADMPAAFSTVLATWELTADTQVTQSREWFDVLPHEPYAPYLVSIYEACAYLRLTGDDEREIVSRLIEQAGGDIEGFIGRAVESDTFTEQVSVGRNQRFLSLRNWPATTITTITDGNGNDYDPSYFDINYPSALLTSAAMPQEGTWTVVYTGGMENLAHYDSTILPVLRLCALDLVAEAYQNRNPGQSSVGDGPTSAVVELRGLPPRVEKRLERYRGI